MIGQCPKCGRFCSSIMGHFLPEHRGGGLRFVTGVCKRHGAVDLTDQDFGYDDFVGVKA